MEVLNEEQVFDACSDIVKLFFEILLAKDEDIMNFQAYCLKNIDKFPEEIREEEREHCEGEVWKYREKMHASLKDEIEKERPHTLPKIKNALSEDSYISIAFSGPFIKIIKDGFLEQRERIMEELYKRIDEILFNVADNVNMVWDFFQEIRDGFLEGIKNHFVQIKENNCHQA